MSKTAYSFPLYINMLPVLSFKTIFLKKKENPVISTAEYMISITHLSFNLL
jgi:hypothetical protein